MNTLIAGLKLYEVVLMIMGCILLLTLIFLLVWAVIKDRKVKVLLPFFILPIAMIGFPSIKSVEFDKWKVDLNNESEYLAQHPDSVARYNRLEEKIKKFDKGRAENDPSALAVLAKALGALGQYDSALKVANKALDLDKNSSEAITQHKRIEEEIAVRDNWNKNILKLNTALADKNQGADEKINSVALILSETKKPVFVDRNSALVYARALNVIDQKAIAKPIVEKIINQEPTHAEAAQLKSELETKSVQPVELTPSVKTKLVEQSVMKHEPNRLIIMKSAVLH